MRLRLVLVALDNRLVMVSAPKVLTLFLTLLQVTVVVAVVVTLLGKTRQAVVPVEVSLIIKARREPEHLIRDTPVVMPMVRQVVVVVVVLHRLAHPKPETITVAVVVLVLLLL